MKRFLVVCFLIIVGLVSAPDSNRYNYYIPPPEYKIVIPLMGTTITRNAWCLKSKDSVVTSASIILEELEFNSLINYIDPRDVIKSRNITVYLNYDIISKSVIELDSIKGISYYVIKDEDISHYCYTGQRETLNFNKELSGKVDRVWTEDSDTIAKKIISSASGISHIQVMSESCIN